MYILKLTLFISIIILLFSGCFTFVATVGSAAMTAQEVDEEYDGSYTDYISDKSNSLYKYIKRKVQ